LTRSAVANAPLEQITLVLAVLVVADDDHLALAQVGDGVFDGGRRPLAGSGGARGLPRSF